MKTIALFLPQCRFSDSNSVTPAPSNTSERPIWQRLQAWGDRLVASLTTTTEPHVWKTYDRQGHRFWHTYDPLTKQEECFASETEVRIWLENRHYA